MPKPNARITQREREICLRVRQIREQIKWSQPDFAKEIGITRNRLDHLEAGRTPLRFDLALKICRKFRVRVEWLVSGESPMRPYVPVSWSGEKNNEMKQIRLLTQAFDFLGGQMSEPRIKFSKSELARDVPFDFDFKKALLQHIARVCDLTKFVDVVESWKFYNKVVSSVDRELQEFYRKGKATGLDDLESEMGPYFYTEMAFLPKNKNIYRKYMLDDWWFSIDNLDMPKIESLEDLIKELKKLTKARGMKVKLANDFGVSRQAVNQWFSKEAKPSAEIIFGLLAWVRDQTKKQQEQ